MPPRRNVMNLSALQVARRRGTSVRMRPRRDGRRHCLHTYVLMSQVFDLDSLSLDRAWLIQC